MAYGICCMFMLGYTLLSYSPLNLLTMTTEQLRKQIHVLEYNLNDKGIKIEYVRYTDTDELGTKKTLFLNSEETARQLSIIGSIDSWSDEIVFSINMDGYDMNWVTFLLNFELSQYEALTLAIRHEMEIELKKDSNLLEMDKTIEALKNI
jgi:hypothetical protein